MFINFILGIIYEYQVIGIDGNDEVGIYIINIFKIEFNNNISIKFIVFGDL